MQNQNNTEKQGRGRPKGSTSYVTITPAKLAELGLNEIPISKAFLRKMNVDSSSFEEFSVKSIIPADDKIEMTITE